MLRRGGIDVMGWRIMAKERGKMQAVYGPVVCHVKMGKDFFGLYRYSKCRKLSSLTCNGC